MEITQFQHLLKEIKNSVDASDSIKLVAIAKDFNTLSDDQVSTAIKLLDSLAEEELKLKIITALISRKIHFNINWINFSRPLLLRSPQYLEHCLGVVSPEKIETFDLLLECATENISEEQSEYLAKLVSKCYDSDQILSLLNLIEKRPTDKVVGAVTEYLFIDDRILQIKALEILKKLSSSLSISAMASVLGRDSQFDILILNALDDIRSKESFEALVSSLGVSSSQVRYFASHKLKALPELALPALNSKLDEASTDVAIAILVILKEIGDSLSAQKIRTLLMFQPKVANLRSAAYDALAQLDFVKSNYLMVAGLEDPIDGVAFAVASHLEENISPSLIQGLLNVVDSEVQPLKRLVEVFSFSKCEKVIEALSINLKFKQALEEFNALQGENHISESLREDPRIWAVDDSGLILRMYERFSKDYGEPIKTFLCAEEALAELKTCSNRPEIIFSDLNMGEMSGIAFAKAIDELNFDFNIPVYLVTTQTDSDPEINMNKNLFDGIISKPFKSADLIHKANLIFKKDI
jgi:CheY-like chemotaxis protein